jgi:hypothetical protein
MNAAKIRFRSIAQITRLDRIVINTIQLLFIVLFITLGTLLWSYPILCILTLIIFIAVFRYIGNIKNQLSDLDARGDTLLISTRKSTFVTSIESLISIRSKNLGPKKLTSVHFNLDGKDHRILLLTPKKISPGKKLTQIKKKETCQ